MRDDNDLLREHLLPDYPFADAVPMAEPVIEGDPQIAEYRPFPVEVLPEPVRSFVAEAASAIGCDPAYVALGVLTGLAASIGNTRRAKLKGNWFEPAVLWTAIVGESGTLKSPALDIALAPLRRLQGKAIDEYRVEKKVYDEELERYLEAKRSRKRSLSGEGQTRPDPPVPWRILCSDITVEALASLLEHAPRGLLLVRDELSGWIASFDRYRKVQGADAAQFLSMHRAGDLLIDRKTNREIIYIRQAAVSIAGGIQPKILTRVLGEQHLDNGLAARLLLVMPPRLPKRWTEDEISPSTARQYSELHGRLLELDFAMDDEGNKVPIDLPLTRSGKEIWVRFFNLHGFEQSARKGDLAAAFSKLEGYCARFALVIHLIRCQGWDEMPETGEAIDAESIKAGAALTRWFAYETERVYAALGIAPACSSPSSLEEIICRHGGRISVRELMHSSRRYRDSSEMAYAALDQLVEAGVGRWVPFSPGRAGRPTQMFEFTQTPGNSGNGNKTLPFGDGLPLESDEIAASYDQRPMLTDVPQAGNIIPNCVTGEEVFPQ